MADDKPPKPYIPRTPQERHVARPKWEPLLRKVIELRGQHLRELEGLPEDAEPPSPGCRNCGGRNFSVGGDEDRLVPWGMVKLDALNLADFHSLGFMVVSCKRCGFSEFYNLAILEALVAAEGTDDSD